jgi:hypothetical protein
MFFVADGQEYKRKFIRQRLAKEPMISVLLAAVNFEWTVGRCILFFSSTPNVELRRRLSRCYGLDAYKELWKSELMGVGSTIPPLAQVVGDWSEFREAFNLRHVLIHGRGTCTRNMATDPVGAMLSATDALYKFSISRGTDLHKRVPIRREKK